MLRYDGNYSSYYDAPREQYPEGSAVDASNGDSYDGTPYKADFFNDIIGFMQAVFHKAFGNPFKSGETATRSVSGAPENANQSDVMDALDKIIGDKVDEAKAMAGDLSDLETTAKSSLVAAVNEVNANAGDLAELDTTAKTNLVTAVNEVNESLGDEKTARQSADTTLDGKIGELTELDTTAKSSLVAAVNEAESHTDWATAAGFKGRNLLTVLGAETVAQAAAALKAKSDAKDYSGLRLGDWLEFTATYGEHGSVKAKWEIVAMGHYHRFYNGSTIVDRIGNIVMMPEKILFTRQIGENTSQKKYFSSPMNTFLAGTVAPAIESVLGVTLKRPYMVHFYNKGTYDSPDWWLDSSNDSTNHDYSDPSYFSQKVFLPSNREINGENGFGCEHWDSSVQFPLFTNAPEKRIARNASGQNSNNEWCRTPSRHPGHFCHVNNDGHSSYHTADGLDGVRPAFCL